LSHKELLSITGGAGDAEGDGKERGALYFYIRTVV
jgi:hypothetical protein